MKAATLVAALTLTILMIPNCTEGIVYFQRLLKGPATDAETIPQGDDFWINPFSRTGHRIMLTPGYIRTTDPICRLPFTKFCRIHYRSPLSNMMG
eukprot:04872.XXX_252858_252467_1 [CDS] Oithona nana genome sequencing.